MNRAPPHLPRRARRAVTLVEAIASIVVIAVVSVAVLPVIFGTSDAYASAAASRRAAERGAYAMERAIRLLRDTPAGAVAGTVDLLIATPTSLRFSDGRGIELAGSTLYLRDTDGTLAVLCRNVSAFDIDYIGTDGVTNTIGTPASTQRFNISVTTSGFELRSSALARVRAMEP